MQADKAFNILEMIIIIIIIGIMLFMAIPGFVDLEKDTTEATEKGVVQGVRRGIKKYKTQKKYVPKNLDKAKNGSCSLSNACFTRVLASGGITGDWKKRGLTYIGPHGGHYSYNPRSGKFD